MKLNLCIINQRQTRYFNCWIHSSFLGPGEKLEPQLKGKDLEKAHTLLQKAMTDAHKSIWVVTSHVYKAIKDRHDNV